MRRHRVLGPASAIDGDADYTRAIALDHTAAPIYPQPRERGSKPPAYGPGTKVFPEFGLGDDASLGRKGVTNQGPTPPRRVAAESKAKRVTMGEFATPPDVARFKEDLRKADAKTPKKRGK